MSRRCACWRTRVIARQKRNNVPPQFSRQSKSEATPLRATEKRKPSLPQHVHAAGARRVPAPVCQSVLAVLPNCVYRVIPGRGRFFMYSQLRAECNDGLSKMWEQAFTEFGRRGELMHQRHVVITGLGVLAPNGCGKEAFWQACLQGRSGVRPITRFAAGDFPTRIAGQIPDFSPVAFGLTPIECRFLDRGTQ